MVFVLLLVWHQQAEPTGGGGVGGFSALQRMRGWFPLTLAYGCFGFMYPPFLGFLTTRLAGRQWLDLRRFHGIFGYGCGHDFWRAAADDFSSAFWVRSYAISGFRAMAFVYGHLSAW